MVAPDSIGIDDLPNNVSCQHQDVDDVTALTLSSKKINYPNGPGRKQKTASNLSFLFGCSYDKRNSHDEESVLTVDSSKPNYFDSLDRKYKVASDLSFLFGSLCFLATASFNYSNAGADAWIYPVWYVTCAVGGSALYLINSIIDSSWAIHNLRRHGGKETIRGHKAKWSILQSALFGLGAGFELILSISYWIADEDGTTPLIGNIELTAAHFYMLSGIAALAGLQRRDYSDMSWYLVLTGTGDLLFFIGCAIDLTMAYIWRFERVSFEESSEHIQALAVVISSTFWLQNAILYVVADFLICKRRRKARSYMHETGEDSLEFVVELVRT